MNKHLTAAAFAAALIAAPALAQEIETYTPEQVTEAQRRHRGRRAER